MADFPIAGASVRVSYGWEVVTTFGTESLSIDKAFSQGVKLNTFDIDNSAEYVYGLGSQDAQKSVVKEFKGTWGIEFALSDPWWLEAILGEAPADAGATPFTHTYDATAGLDDKQVSMSIVLGFDQDTDSNQTLLGCICNAMTLTAAVGDIVKVTLDGMFKTLAKDTTLDSWVEAVEDPFSFACASFECPNASTIADVQSIEMAWNRNNKFVWGLGSRHAQANVPTQREWNIRLTATYENDTQFWDDLLGSTTAPTLNPAEVATCELTITNGLTLIDMRKYVFLFANVRIERGAISASTDALVTQDITLRARTLTSVVVSNGTETAL